MMRLSLGLRARATVVGLLMIVANAGRAQAYGVRLRWQAVGDAAVAGYRVHVNEEPDLVPAPVDAGVPVQGQDGTFSAVVTGLDPFTDYAIAVSGLLEGGGETPTSNVVHIGYAQVAGVIDTDGDGVKDAADACPGTRAGAAVGPNGCTCDQLTCDDGDPCNGIERCDGGTCLPGTPLDCSTGGPCSVDDDCIDDDACTTDEHCTQGRCIHANLHCAAGAECTTTRCDPSVGCTTTPMPDGTSCTAADPCAPEATCAAGVCTAGDVAPPPTTLGVQSFSLRPVRGGRSWRLRATAVLGKAERSSLVAEDVHFSLWGDGAPMPYVASVAGPRFAPSSRRLHFVSSGDHETGGLQRLDIVLRDGFRLVQLAATIPGVALPHGASSPVTWVVRFGATCARDRLVTCWAAGRGFLCR